jgi:predicted lipid-binding transport protein (Tim44 family)
VNSDQFLGMLGIGIFSGALLAATILGALSWHESRQIDAYRQEADALHAQRMAKYDEVIAEIDRITAEIRQRNAELRALNARIQDTGK